MKEIELSFHIPDQKEIEIGLLNEWEKDKQTFVLDFQSFLRSGKTCQVCWRESFLVKRLLSFSVVA